MTMTPETKTPEQIAQDARSMAFAAYPHRNVFLEGGAYAAEERSRIPLREAFAAGWRASIDALRAAGLLVEGAPTEEQIERGAKALFEDPGVEPEYTWAQMVAEDPTRADIWREDTRRVLTAAGVAPQEPSEEASP